MQAKWAASVCAVALIFGLAAIGQESGNSNDPVLKTRPNDSTDRNDRNTPPPQQRASRLSRTRQSVVNIRSASKRHC